MNYPSGIKREKCKLNNYGNRGMILEDDINETNKYYLVNDIAVIHKKPTTVTVKKVIYPDKNKNKIIDGYFKTPSTTDYNGIYKGRYIDFEAKETKKINYFPLNNIHSHQIRHICNIIKHGGIGFIIVRFTSLDETFYLDGTEFLKFINNSTRKSIPYSYFKSNGFLIKPEYNPRINYLKVIDQIYFKGADNI